MTDLFDQLRGDMARTVAQLRPDALAPAEADRVLAALTHMKALVAGAELLVAARACEGEAGRKAAERLAARAGTSVGDAESMVSASKSLASLPVVSDALRSGALSPPQARLVVDACETSPSSQSDLLSKAASEDLKGLRDACARAKAAADPDPTGRRRRIHARRCVRFWTDADGTRRGSWAMTAEAAAEVEAAVSAFTDRVFRQARRAGAREALECYRADALVAMARATTRRAGTRLAPRTPTAPGDDRHRPDPTAATRSDGFIPERPDEKLATDRQSPAGQGGRAPDTDRADLGDDPPVPIARELVIVVDLATLTDTHPYLQPPGGPPRAGRICELRGIGPVAPEVAREWLENAFLKSILTNGTDVKLVDHPGRKAPAHLKSALDYLHPVCTDPGCNRCQRLEYDHDHPHALGGTINLDNYRPKCGPSHRAKTRQDLIAIRAARAQDQPPPDLHDAARVGQDPTTSSRPAPP